MVFPPYRRSTVVNHALMFGQKAGHPPFHDVWTETLGNSPFPVRLELISTQCSNVLSGRGIDCLDDVVVSRAAANIAFQMHTNFLF